MKNTASYAFTSTHSEIANRLLSDVEISNADGKTVKVRAVWDTGATASCISAEVARELQLKSVGKKKITTPSGGMISDIYVVDVALSRQMLIPDVKVYWANIGNQNVGMMIGMDIITRGDLSVSNYDGHTVFSFRIPSKKTTDFLKED